MVSADERAIDRLGAFASVTSECGPSFTHDRGGPRRHSIEGAVLDVPEAILPGPNPSKPDAIFRDGDHKYDVGVWPARFPVAGTRVAHVSGSDELLLMGVYVAAGFIARLVDRRWKVVVSRAADRRLALWKVVAVEFFASVEEAEARRREVLRSWVSGQFTNSPPIGVLQRRRLRRESRPSS